METIITKVQKLTNLHIEITQSAEAVEYTDCTSAEE